MQSYKQDCSNISYNCNTDTISANCGRGITSFTNALDCLDVLNVGGALRCLPASPPAPSSSSACALRYHFESKIDQSGLDAPDGVSLLHGCCCHVCAFMQKMHRQLVD